MIIDTDTQFCVATSVANAAGTFLLGSQIDAAVAGTLDVNNLNLKIVVTTAIITGGSAGTLQFKLSSDTTAAVSTSTALDVLLTEVFVTGATAIPAGTVLFDGGLPADLGTYTPSRRYLGILEVVGTTTITAGAVTIWLGLDKGRWAPTTIAVN